MFSSQVISKGISFITVAYLARILSPYGFGIISFSTAFISYFIIFDTFGLDTYGTREVARDLNKIKLLVNSIISFRFTLALILYLLLSIIVYFLNQSILLKIILLISGFSILSNSIQISWVFQGLEKMHLSAAQNLFSSILNLFGVIILVHSKNQIITACIISSISVFIGNMSLLFYYLRNISRIKLTFDLNAWKVLLKNSFPSGLSSILIAVYYNLDVLMLGFMRTQKEVGLYSAAYKIMFVFSIFNIYMMVIFPKLSKLWQVNENKFFEMIGNITVLIWSFTFLVVSFSQFGDFFVIYIFGKDYSEASLVTSILIINQCLIFLFSPFAYPLIARNKHNKFLKSVSIGAVVNLILNLVLIPDYGILGAAIATLASELLVGISQLYYFGISDLHKCGINFSRPIIIGVVINLFVLFMLFMSMNIFLTIILACVIFLFLAKFFKVLNISKYFISQ